MSVTLSRFWSVGPALALALALFAPPAPQAAPFADGPAAAAEARKKKDDAASGGEAEKSKDGEKKDDKDQPKEPAFDKVVKGTTELKGLFTIHIKEDENKYYLEIAPDQFDQEFLLAPTLVSGLGQNFIYPADMLPEYLVSFHRNGKTVQLIHRNALFGAGTASTLHGPAGRAVPDAVVGQAKIESQPHPDRKSVLIDLGGIFLGDLEGLSLALKQIFEVPYQVDKDGSAVALAKAFPENVDFETVLHYRTPDVKRPLVYAADSRSLLVRFRYSIARLPHTGFRPRLADDRVGHFPAMMKDYSDDRPDEPTLRYVNRWHLEKKDPAAAVSEPKQPIVFYLESSIPDEYRQAVREGIVGWNAAFDAIGFRNAIVAKDQPADDKDWDAADVRYSTIRWIVAPNAGFAQGPSRVHPRTGQIFDADIRFSVDMIRNIRHEYDEMVATVGAAAAPSGPAAALRGWTSMLGPLPLEDLLADAASPRALVGAGARPWLPRAALGYCEYGRGLSQQAALGWSLLDVRGRLTDAEQEKYINDFIVHVTLHEVGHTLGLRHNFKASGIHPFERLQDAAFTAKAGLTGSVMDYTPVNISPEGRPQGQYWQTNIGTYDKWAIEYAYKPIAAETVEDERPELERIAARASDPLLAYGTDEDTFTGSPRGIDPMSNMYDNGNDVLGYYRSRALLARELFSKMEERFNRPGWRYQTMRRVFAQGIGELVPAAMNVPKFIGGIRHHRDHIGDPNGRMPYDPVPAAEQRQALAFLNEVIFGPEAFQFSPSLLNKLAVERFPDIEGAVWTIERNDLPIHTLVLAIQSVPIDRLYHPISLNRLNDVQARYTGREQAFTMAEMFGSVRGTIWSEIDARQSVNSFRRNLQRKHLGTLIDLVVNLGPGAPEDARTLARADLLALRRGIDALVAANGRPLPAAARLDAVTVAHLEETRARITAALEASLERQLAAPRQG